MNYNQGPPCGEFSFVTTGFRQQCNTVDTMPATFKLWCIGLPKTEPLPKEEEKNYCSRNNPQPSI
jgi:hypothetical protein